MQIEICTPSCLTKSPASLLLLSLSTPLFSSSKPCHGHPCPRRWSFVSLHPRPPLNRPASGARHVPFLRSHAIPSLSIPCLSRIHLRSRHFFYPFVPRSRPFPSICRFQCCHRLSCKSTAVPSSLLYTHLITNHSDSLLSAPRVGLSSTCHHRSPRT